MATRAATGTKTAAVWRRSMRSDMWQVIIERPRYDSGRRRKGRTRAPDEDAPRREVRGERARRRSKYLNENLAPLRRFLEKRIGRPWSKVLSEVCAEIDSSTAVQKHVRDHLVRDLVETQAVLIDGIPHHPPHRRGGRPIDRRTFYACPRTGLLRRPRSRKEPLRPVVTAIELEGGSRTYELIAGQWFEVTWRSLWTEPVWDVVRRETIVPGAGDARPGDDYAAAKAQCGRAALRAIAAVVAGKRVEGLMPVRRSIAIDPVHSYELRGWEWKRVRWATIGREPVVDALSGARLVAGEDGVFAGDRYAAEAKRIGREQERAIKAALARRGARALPYGRACAPP